MLKRKWRKAKPHRVSVQLVNQHSHDGKTHGHFSEQKETCHMILQVHYWVHVSTGNEISMWRETFTLIFIKALFATVKKKKP